MNLFYGNGTSLDVKKSPWKDKANGVTYDLGSHLIDLIFSSIKNLNSKRLIFINMKIKQMIILIFFKKHRYKNKL